MSQIRTEVWDEIARQYRAGIAVGVIGQTFNVSDARIRSRAKRFGWTRGPVKGGDVLSPDGTSGPSPEAGTAAAQTVADAHRRLFERHRAAWASVDDWGDEVFRILRGEELQILKGLQMGSAEERIEYAAKMSALYEKHVRAQMIAQEGERRAYGLDYKQQQAAQVEDEAQARRRQELVGSVIDLVSQLKRTGGVDSSDKAS